MSVGYILIVAILVLGGVIATVGDHLGTRIGKARLSLFNLRPRKTAILVTILTGSLIAASTLGILLATSGPLRSGILDIEQIQRRLRKTRHELRGAREQKAQIESELAKVQAERVKAQERLDEVNRSLSAALARQSRTQSRLNQVASSYQQAQNRLDAVTQQAQSLRSEITRLQTERQKLLEQQSQVREQIARRDRDIALRDQEIAQREKRLNDLERQQTFLDREVQRLEREAQGLRLGNFALQRGQVLSSAVVRIVDPTAARQAVDQLLAEANRSASQITRPGVDNKNEQIIQITRSEVEQVIDEIDDGQDYVIRVFSAANYLLGESPIQVLADAVRNQVVFLAGDVVASVSVDPSETSQEQLQQQINLLIAASNFRARRLGILNDTVQIGRIQTVVDFIEQLQKYDETIDIKAVTTEVTYTAGPLKIKLVATRNGEVLFST